MSVCRDPTLSFERALELNPCFFEAQYQILMHFFKLNECPDVFHFNYKYAQLLEPSQTKATVCMFGILFTSAVSANIYVGKVFKIRVKNKRKVALYLKLIKTECSYRLAFNDEDQLINFLKYGKVIAVEVSHIIIKLIDLLICSRFKRQ